MDKSNAYVSRKESIAMKQVYLEKATKHFLEKLNALKGPQLYEMSVNDARKFLRDAQAGPVKVPPTTIKDLTIKGGPNKEVSVRIVRPEGVEGRLPGIIYLHGSGWALGDEDTHNRLIRELSYRTGAAVIFVNYTPSPEAHYPIALEEAYAVLLHAADKNNELSVDHSHSL